MARKADITKMSPFGEKVMHQLEERGITQKALARSICVSAQHINLIMMGKVNPSLRTVSQIAKELDIDAGELTKLVLKEQISDANG